MANQRHGMKELYQRARVLRDRLGNPDDITPEQSFNGVLALLIKKGEHPTVVGSQLGITERQVRDRVTLDEPGLVHSDPSDFRQTADHIGESLRGQIDARNLAAAPLLRVKALLYKLAQEYETAQEANRQAQERRERQVS